MQTCRLLYLTAQQLLAFRWHAGHFDEREAFVAGEPGSRRFEAYLAAHADEVYVLLVNIADEGFAIETIPFLRGADRAAIIRRRLAQTFFNAPFTATLTLGYQLLEKQRSTPDGMFLEISKALKDAPTIEIDSIDWSTEPDPGQAKPGSDGATALLPADTESALVRGRLHIGSASSLPEVIDRFDRFVATLRDNPALAVRVLARPIDLDADSPLRDADVVVEGVAARPFTLRLSRKIGS